MQNSNNRKKKVPNWHFSHLHFSLWHFSFPRLRLDYFSLLVYLVFFLVFVQCSSKFALTEEQKQDPEFLLYQGRNFYIQEKYKSAIQLFDRILKQFPDRTYEASWAEYETGMIHYLKKDYRKARQSFVRVLQKYPVPSQPRVLALVLIRKIDQGQAYKRSNYD